MEKFTSKSNIMDVTLSFDFNEQTDKEKIMKLMEIAHAFKGSWFGQGVDLESYTRDVSFEFKDKKSAKDFTDTVLEIFPDVKVDDNE